MNPVQTLIQNILQFTKISNLLQLLKAQLPVPNFNLKRVQADIFDTPQ